MKQSIAMLMAYLIFCLVLTPNQASAYIDPSTTTFLVQAVVGVAVAVAAGFTIYWRKAKKKISKVMGKEEAAAGKDRGRRLGFPGQRRRNSEVQVRTEDRDGDGEGEIGKHETG